MVVSMTVPFCGRDSEMAALSEQLDQARGGAGTVVLVEGDAGMGKSRLLDEAVAVARRRGFRIGIGVADPGDGMVELATLMAALFDGPDPILDRAELPDWRTLPEQRYWVLQDLQGLLERAARQTPLLICLDGRLVPARRPDNGWAALTDSELAVARLVAQGLSNREVAEHLFLSPHTVSGHLRHVFAKLGVNSRVDLARIAASHEAERAEP
jgi:DNA-binding CsgD family transcriptional regulator